jgi:hypothetical protein
VARRLKASLESRLGVRAILTRDADETVGLEQRAAVANNNKADVFVSLHANAALRPLAAGAEIFYLSLEEYGDRAQAVAKLTSETLPVVGGGVRDIEVIPWEMAQARYIGPVCRPGGGGRIVLPRPHPSQRPRCPAGTVSRAGRRQHAGGADRDGIPDEPRTGKADGVGYVSGHARPGAG